MEWPYLWFETIMENKRKKWKEQWTVLCPLEQKQNKIHFHFHFHFLHYYYYYYRMRNINYSLNLYLE
jgi:hypothetical protein